MRRIGVIDLGTNSSRLLIADVDGERLEEVERRTTVTRLGEGVESSGRLSDAAIGRVTEAVAGYRELIDRHGAEAVTCVATSAMRDAANGDDLARLLRDRYDVNPEVIAGDEEARLSFLGATSGRGPGSAHARDRHRRRQHRVRGRAPGERAVLPRLHANGLRPPHRAPPPLGPPGRGRAGGARRGRGPDHRGRRPGRDPRRGASAGSPWPAPPRRWRRSSSGSTRTTPSACTATASPGARAQTCSGCWPRCTVAERREVVGLQPDRAPTIVAGVVILARSLHAFGLGEVEVSEADILNGAALDAAAEGLGMKAETTPSAMPPICSIVRLAGWRSRAA